MEEVLNDHFGQNEFFCANLLVLVGLSRTQKKSKKSNVKYENRPPMVSGLQRFIVEEVHFSMLLITN